MTLKTERRTRLRKRPLSLVYVELPPSNGGMMRDLSEHGFSLRAMMPLQQSEKVPFSFVLDTSARIEGEAIVVRLDDGGHVAALEFAGLPSHSRDQIGRWLDRFDEPISTETTPAQPMSSKHASLTELRSQIRAPRPPSTAPPVTENAPPPTPPKVTAPPKLEPPRLQLSPTAEITPQPQNIAAPPRQEPPPASVTPASENTPPPPPIVTAPKPEPPLPPAAENPQPPPVQMVMALPKLAPPPPQEAPSPLPPAPQASFEQSETPPLPPLLKLSSVRPGPLPIEISAEPVASVAIPEPVVEPPARIHVPRPKPEPPATMETRIPEPLPVPPVEGETDSEIPGWMDRFTLGRAIGIMLFLTLLAGSYVYHRELGHALIWLGHEIAGDDSPESSTPARPGIPFASQATPKSTPSARAVEPPTPSVQESPASTEPKSANLPAAPDKTPGSLVPLTEVTRAPASTPPTDNSVEAGQQEYLEALQILRSRSRASEVPAAVQLLWVAVKKGNTGAEIDLAELFRTGRGVTKNCVQTRILLSAAARKGSMEARKRLEALRREGCGN